MGGWVMWVRAFVESLWEYSRWVPRRGKPFDCTNGGRAGVGYWVGYLWGAGLPYDAGTRLF